MFSTEDTIVAIATPPGRGGIGVVRISGSRSVDVARTLIQRRGPLAPRHATLTVVHAVDADGSATFRPIDQAVATFFPGPHSYTGEDVVELSTHGSPVVLHAIVSSAVAAGARPARAGEFTLRAFLNGRIDLPQAEAVADLIDAVTPLQVDAAFDQLQGTLTRAIAEIDAELFDVVARLEASIDFPDEGYHFIAPGTLQETLARVRARLAAMIERGRQGRVIREGRVVAIVGGPNVGKSSVFNALVGSARAIVTPIPGTTRDLVSEMVDIGGIRVTLVDTAGLRETLDVVESEGITRSAGAALAADLVIAVRDGTTDAPSFTLSARAVLDVDNKCDRLDFRGRPGVLAVSATEGTGLDELREAVARALTGAISVDCPEITNTRHLDLVGQAAESIGTAEEAVNASSGSLSEEFVLADLQRARSCLEEVTGRRTTDDLLAHIFGRFCIGK